MIQLRRPSRPILSSKKQSNLNPNPDQDPDISAKLQKLIAAGVLQVR